MRPEHKLKTETNIETDTDKWTQVAHAIGARGLVCTSSKTGYGLGTEQADGGLPEEGKLTINSQSTLLLCSLTWTAVLSYLLLVACADTLIDPNGLELKRMIMEVGQ